MSCFSVLGLFLLRHHLFFPCDLCFSSLNHLCFSYARFLSLALGLFLLTKTFAHTVSSLTPLVRSHLSSRSPRLLCSTAFRFALVAHSTHELSHSLRSLPPRRVEMGKSLICKQYVQVSEKNRNDWNSYEHVLSKICSHSSILVLS